MARSLRWQVLGPQGLLLAGALVLVAAELDNRDRMAARHEAIDQMRGRLDRATLRLSERHVRTVRRAREALLRANADDRSSILAWTADRYLSDMERFVDEASKSLRAVRVPDAAPRLVLDLRRLEKQLERVLSQAREVAAALSSLMEAAALQEGSGFGRGSAESRRGDARRLSRTRRVPDDGARRPAAEETTPEGRLRPEDQRPELADGLAEDERDGEAETPDRRTDGDRVEGEDAEGSLEAQPISTDLTEPRVSLPEAAPGSGAASETRGSAEAAQAMQQAQQRLERADRAMHTSLRIVDGMVRRATSWQARHAARPISAPAVELWLALALLVPLVLWITQRSVGRLKSLATGASLPGRFVSTEERLVGAQIDSLRSSEAKLEERLSALAHDVGRAEKQARRSASELALLHLYNENLVNSLRSAVVVTDAAGSVVSFNRPARALLALSDSDVGTPIAQHPLHHTLAARSPDIGAELGRSMAGKHPLRFDGIPYGGGAGSLLLDLTVAPYQDESGAARGLLWIADDVTEQVRTKTQLLAAERLAAVGRISAQVAHEIRNPLSAIALNAELLEEEISQGLDERERGEAFNLLRAMAAEIERLTEVTEGYLQLARMPRPTFQQTDMNRLVSELFGMHGEEMKVSGISVQLDLATPAPVAWADPGQLRQALLNIVRNSREAMTSGGTLRVSTHASETESEIEITDTGPGIPAEVLPRIFEPFYSTKPDGTGLGLSLTQQIIAEHGGTIDVRAASPWGTRTRLSVPRATPDQDPGDN